MSWFLFIQIVALMFVTSVCIMLIISAWKNW